MPNAAIVPGVLHDSSESATFSVWGFHPNSNIYWRLVKCPNGEGCGCDGTVWPLGQTDNFGSLTASGFQFQCNGSYTVRFREEYTDIHADASVLNYVI